MKDVVGWVGPMECIVNSDLLYKVDVGDWVSMLRKNLAWSNVVVDKDNLKVTLSRGNCDPGIFDSVIRCLEKIRCNDEVYLINTKSGQSDIKFVLDFSNVEVVLYNGKICSSNSFFIMDNVGLNKEDLLKMLQNVVVTYLKYLNMRIDNESLRISDTGTYFKFKFVCDSHNVASMIAKSFYSFMQKVYWCEKDASKYVQALQKKYGNVLTRMAPGNFDAVFGDCFGDCFDNYWYRIGDKYFINMNIVYKDI